MFQLKKPKIKLVLYNECFSRRRLKLGLYVMFQQKKKPKIRLICNVSVDEA